MTGEDRTVQVPVSLPTREQIESTVDEAIGKWWDDGALLATLRPAVRDAVLVLLSQPTPTAEPEFEPEEDRLGMPYIPGPLPTAEPPRIEHMAPGTTFRFGKSDTLWTLYYNATFENFYVVSPDGSVWQAEDIDPSTIRDVTPPAVTL